MAGNARDAGGGADAAASAAGTAAAATAPVVTAVPPPHAATAPVASPTPRKRGRSGEQEANSNAKAAADGSEHDSAGKTPPRKRSKQSTPSPAAAAANATTSAAGGDSATGPAIASMASIAAADHRAGPPRKKLGRPRKHKRNADIVTALPQEDAPEPAAPGESVLPRKSVTAATVPVTDWRSRLRRDKQLIEAEMRFMMFDRQRFLGRGPLRRVVRLPRRSAARKQGVFLKDRTWVTAAKIRAALKRQRRIEREKIERKPALQDLQLDVPMEDIYTAVDETMDELLQCVEDDHTLVLANEQALGISRSDSDGEAEDQVQETASESDQSEKEAFAPTVDAAKVDYSRTEPVTQLPGHLGAGLRALRRFGKSCTGIPCTLERVVPNEGWLVSYSDGEEEVVHEADLLAAEPARLAPPRAAEAEVHTLRVVCSVLRDPRFKFNSGPHLLPSWTATGAVLPSTQVVTKRIRKARKLDEDKASGSSGTRGNSSGDLDARDGPAEGAKSGESEDGERDGARVVGASQETIDNTQKMVDDLVEEARGSDKSEREDSANGKTDGGQEAKDSTLAGQEETGSEQKPVDGNGATGRKEGEDTEEEDSDKSVQEGPANAMADGQKATRGDETKQKKHDDDHRLKQQQQQQQQDSDMSEDTASEQKKGSKKKLTPVDGDSASSEQISDSERHAQQQKLLAVAEEAEQELEHGEKMTKRARQHATRRALYGPRSRACEILVDTLLLGRLVIRGGRSLLDEPIANAWELYLALEADRHMLLQRGSMHRGLADPANRMELGDLLAEDHIVWYEQMVKDLPAMVEHATKAAADDSNYARFRAFAEARAAELEAALDMFLAAEEQAAAREEAERKLREYSAEYAARIRRLVSVRPVPTEAPSFRFGAQTRQS